MNIAAWVRGVMSLYTPLSDVVGDRVYLIALPQNPTYPSISFLEPGTEEPGAADFTVHGFDTTGNLRNVRTRIRFRVHSSSAAEAYQVCDLVFDAFMDYVVNRDNYATAPPVKFGSVVHVRYGGNKDTYVAEVGSNGIGEYQRHLELVFLQS